MSRISNQLRRLGGSYDWSRKAYTMDPPLYRAVIENFCRLHEDGIIYRANRLVNWCVRLNTTLSNLEVRCYYIPIIPRSRSLNPRSTKKHRTVASSCPSPGTGRRSSPRSHTP